MPRALRSEGLQAVSCKEFEILLNTCGTTKTNTIPRTFKARALQQYLSNESKIEDDDEKWLAHSPDIAPVWLAERRLQAIHDLHVNKQMQGFDYNASTGRYDLQKKTKPVASDIWKHAQTKRKRRIRRRVYSHHGLHQDCPLHRRAMATPCAA